MGCHEETNDESSGCRLHDCGYGDDARNNEVNMEASAKSGATTGGDAPQDAPQTDIRDRWMYRGNEMDLQRYLKFHPGGTSPLKYFKGLDVESAMRSTPHSQEAYYLLRDFCDGNPAEEVVDWSQPMLGQVGRLGPLYATWVWRPVDRRLRLFHNEWLEALTRTNWKQVVGVWVPIIAAALILSLVNSPPHLTMVERWSGTFSSVMCGMAVWPLLEYSIHRWLFHTQPPDSSPLLITLHFGLHGLHHKVPFDEGRLLFPPGPCSAMALALYHLYRSILSRWLALAAFSGTMLGYLVYDLIHYYLHHGNPKDGSYLYYMKRYHNQHHFSQQDRGFGISSDFWDNAFDSTVKLKNLLKPLRWD